MYAPSGHRITPKAGAGLLALAQAEVKKRRTTESGAKLILAATAASCAAVLLAVPRPTDPLCTPPLLLDASEVAAAIAADEARAAAAPEDETANRIDALFQQVGRSASGGTDAESAPTMHEIRAALEAFTAAHDEQSLGGLRARALSSLARALRAELDADEAVGRLGVFPQMLANYGLSSGGELTAPAFVVRSLYKARWNGIFRRELTEGMAPVEREAYYGWLALRAETIPPRRRVLALEAWAEASGRDATEARAYLNFAAGDRARAAIEFQEAYEATGNLRLRNHALAALHTM